MEPSFTLSFRHDGGDAETASEVEIGIGPAWSDPSRGRVSELRLYSLFAHEDGGYDQWSARFGKELGYGLSLSAGLTGMPYMGHGFDREYHVGWRLVSGHWQSFPLGLEATRRPPSNSRSAGRARNEAERRGVAVGRTALRQCGAVIGIPSPARPESIVDDG